MGTGSISEHSAVQFTAAAEDRRLLRTQGNERLTEIHLEIEGMRDDDCARAVEGAIGLIGGVRAVRVSFITQGAWVVFESARVREWQFERAVRAMGYRLETHNAAPGNLGAETQNEERSNQWNG